MPCSDALLAVHLPSTPFTLPHLHGPGHSELAADHTMNVARMTTDCGLTFLFSEHPTPEFCRLNILQIRLTFELRSNHTLADHIGSHGASLSQPHPTDSLLSQLPKTEFLPSLTVSPELWLDDD